MQNLCLKLSSRFLYDGNWSKHLNLVLVMWTCPNCKRSFRNTNQGHSCTQVLNNNVFAGRPAFLKKLYDQIIAEVKQIGSYREETVSPGVIYFKTKSTFLALKVKKTYLEVEFFLDHHADDPSIASWLQTSKHRFVHVVKLDGEYDITNQLAAWIKHSYHLILS